jgi:hypothetical protein
MLFIMFSIICGVKNSRNCRRQFSLTGNNFGDLFIKLLAKVVSSA